MYGKLRTRYCWNNIVSYFHNFNKCPWKLNTCGHGTYHKVNRNSSWIYWSTYLKQKKKNSSLWRKTRLWRKYSYCLKTTAAVKWISTNSKCYGYFGNNNNTRVHTDSRLRSDLSKLVPSTCRFGYREDYRLQYVFVVVLSSSRQMLEHYLKTCHNRFLSHPSHLIHIICAAEEVSLS